jgi:O-antigen/teichoic acid export membrane protein
MTALKDKAVTGFKWSTASQVGRQGTQLLTMVLLARLLSPVDFGLSGMAMVVIGFVGIFKDLGTSAAVIQRQNLSEALLSSLFWINIGFGTLVTVVLYIIAPLIGLFYQEPRVVQVVQVLSVSFFISSLGVIQKALLERSLSFKSLAMLEIISSLLGAVVGIGLALNHAGVWSLVFQSLTTTTITTVLLWFYSSYRFQFSFYWDEVRKVSSFSLNLIGFSIFNYFARNADNILIGRYLGAQPLGYYSLAYNILLFSTNIISGVTSRVVNPVYSVMQDNNIRFTSTYLKMASSIALITFPVMAGEFVLARPLILTFLGDKWQPVILLVMILAPVGLVQSVGSTVGSIYQAKGRTDLMFRWGVGSSIFVVCAFLIGLRWGIVGVAGAYAIATIIILYPSFFIPFRLIDLKFVEFLKTLKASFFNSLLMLFVLLLFEGLIFSRFSNLVELILSVILGVAIYSIASWMTNRELIKEVLTLIFHKTNEV